MSTRPINTAGLALVKEFEGLFKTAYHDMVGVLTIGWGHTGPDVHVGMTITEAQAETLLQDDLQKAGADVIAALSGVTLNDNQYAALTSLVFNVGGGALHGTNLAAMLKSGNMKAAADGILKFDHAGGQQVKGLTRRREAERKLFLTPVQAESAPEPAAAWTINAGGQTIPAVVINGATYAPVRSLAEALGYSVDIDGKTVTLTKP
jgi:lysozyme